MLGAVHGDRETIDGNIVTGVSLTGRATILAGRLANVIDSKIDRDQNVLVLSVAAHDLRRALMNRRRYQISFGVGNLVLENLGDIKFPRLPAFQMQRKQIMSAFKKQCEYVVLSLVGGIPDRNHGVITVAGAPLLKRLGRAFADTSSLPDVRSYAGRHNASPSRGPSLESRMSCSAAEFQIRTTSRAFVPTLPVCERAATTTSAR